MSYLESVRVFVRVIELGSISAAGRDQRLTPAVASNRIKELETRLGVRLLNRTTRKVAPTEIGRLFYDHACRILAAVDAAEAAVAAHAGRPRGALRALAPLGTGRQLIAPLIPAFTADYPDIEVRLRLTDRKVDFLAEGIDVGFVLGELPDSTMKMRAIARCERVLVAAPAYLAGRPMPQGPDDLVTQDHNCLLLRFPGSTEYYWQLLENGRWRKVQVHGTLDADDAQVLLDWALAGQGIVNRPWFEVAEHVAAGRLVPLLLAHPPKPATLACLTPHRRLQDPKIRLFADFMVRECRRRIHAVHEAHPCPVVAALP